MKNNGDVDIIRILKDLTDEQIKKMENNPDLIEWEEYKEIADKMNVGNVIGVYILGKSLYTRECDIFVPKRSEDCLRLDVIPLQNTIMKQYIRYCSSKHLLGDSLYQHSKYIHVLNMFKQHNIVILNLNLDYYRNEDIDYYIEFELQKMCVKMILYLINRNMNAYTPNVDLYSPENYENILTKDTKYSIYKTDYALNSLKVIY